LAAVPDLKRSKNPELDTVAGRLATGEVLANRTSTEWRAVYRDGLIATCPPRHFATLDAMA